MQKWKADFWQSGPPEHHSVDMKRFVNNQRKNWISGRDELPTACNCYTEKKKRETVDYWIFFKAYLMKVFWSTSQSKWIVVRLCILIGWTYGKRVLRKNLHGLCLKFMFLGWIFEAFASLILPITYLYVCKQ